MSFIFRPSLPLLFSALFLLSACGSETDVQPSETFSLVGFPCQSYGGNVVAKERKCLNLKGTGGRHPDMEILLDLQGFSDSQLEKIKQAADIFVAHWNQRVEQEKSLGGINTDFQKCLESRTKAELFPPGSSWPLEHRGVTQAAGWAILNVTYMLEHHAAARLPVVVKAATLGADVLGKVDDFGREGKNDTLATINLNRVTLDDATIPARIFAGTLFHEWLHRKNYQHPNTNRDSLIYVAGNCVRHGNNSGGFLNEREFIE